MKRNGFFMILGSLMIITLSFTACSSPISQPEDPLNGTNWELIFYRKSRVIEGSSITIHFTNAEINGSAGCNSFFGSYQVYGQILSIGEIANTEMFCMEPEGVMEQEVFYLEALADAQRFEIANEQLTIFLSGHETLTFKPAE